VDVGGLRRAPRREIKLGICGEHGGDPASIAFCERVGLDYVSCSPFRVPIARLATAQAALGRKAASTAAGRSRKTRPARLHRSGLHGWKLQGLSAVISAASIQV
jgi:phosphoenolpyruvate-protein kinase (PTS system EI component)